MNQHPKNHNNEKNSIFITWFGCKKKNVIFQKLRQIIDNLA